jgi:hypothetical protein
MLKRFLWTITLICSFSLNLVFAQNAQIIEKQVLLPTYSFSDPDPVPAPGKTYPISGLMVSLTNRKCRTGR